MLENSNASNVLRPNHFFRLLKNKTSFGGYKAEKGRKCRVVRLGGKPREALVLKNFPEPFFVEEHHLSAYEKIKPNEPTLGPLHHTLQYNNGLKVRVYYDEDGNYCRHRAIHNQDGFIKLEDDESYRIRRDSELYVKGIIHQMVEELRKEERGYTESIEKLLIDLDELSKKGITQPAYLVLLKQAICLVSEKNQIFFNSDIGLEKCLRELQEKIQARLQASEVFPKQLEDNSAQSITKQNSPHKNNGQSKTALRKKKGRVNRNKVESSASEIRKQNQAQLKDDFDRDIQSGFSIKLYQRNIALIEKMWAFCEIGNGDANYARNISEREKRLEAMRQNYILKICCEADDVKTVSKLLNLDKDILLLQKLEAIAQDYDRPNLLEFFHQEKLKKWPPHPPKQEGPVEEKGVQGAQIEKDDLEGKPVQFYKPSFTLLQLALGNVSFKAEKEERDKEEGRDEKQAYRANERGIADQCLAICAYLAPEISISLFHQLMPDNFRDASQKIDKALKSLKKRGLLKINNSTISISPLVQKNIRQSLQINDQKEVCLQVLRKLADILDAKVMFNILFKKEKGDDDTVTEKILTLRLEPHLKNIIHHHQQINPKLFPFPLAVLSANLAKFYQDYPDKQQECYNYYLLAIRVMEENALQNTEEFVFFLQTLSAMCNDLKEKQKHLLRALTIQETLYGQNNPQLILTLRFIVDAYINLKDNLSALKIVLRILGISKTMSGSLSQIQKDFIDYAGQFLKKVLHALGISKTIDELLSEMPQDCISGTNDGAQLLYERILSVEKPQSYVAATPLSLTQNTNNHTIDKKEDNSGGKEEVVITAPIVNAAAAIPNSLAQSSLISLESKEELKKPEPANSKPHLNLNYFKKHKNPAIYAILISCGHTAEKISLILLPLLIPGLSISNQHIQDAVKALAQGKNAYLLLEEETGSIKIKPGVKNLRRRCSLQDQRMHLKTMLDTFLMIIKSPFFNLCEKELSTHLDAIGICFLEYIKAANSKADLVALESLLSLLHTVYVNFSDPGTQTKAKIHFENILEVATQKLGENDILVASILDTLIKVYSTLKMEDKKQDCVERLSSIRHPISAVEIPVAPNAAQSLGQHGILPRPAGPVSQQPHLPVITLEQGASDLNSGGSHEKPKLNAYC
ncbi:MAG: hypothetical protein K0Q74_419 [Gammaproteobacteria bacterium]|nr:hypothetical protein [Gammaproteobacteria bacterium]